MARLFGYALARGWSATTSLWSGRKILGDWPARLRSLYDFIAHLAVIRTELEQSWTAKAIYDRHPDKFGRPGLGNLAYGTTTLSATPPTSCFLKPSRKADAVT